MIEADRRGQHSNRPFTVPETLKNTARDHISSFLVIELHYCRENSTRNYLEEGLSLAKMYRLFVEKCKSNSEKTYVSFQTNVKIFNTEYKYGFFKPKKDR